MSEIKNDGGQAFPIPELIVVIEGKEVYSTSKPGMSLRDYFAANAMQGFMRLSFSSGGGYMQYATHAEQAAKCAYQLADAMLAHRNPAPDPDKQDHEIADCQCCRKQVHGDV